MITPSRSLPGRANMTIIIRCYCISLLKDKEKRILRIASLVVIHVEDNWNHHKFQGSVTQLGILHNN